MGILGTLLFTSALAHAFTEAELKQRQKVIGQLEDAARYAESSLSACDDLDYFANASERISVSKKLCPRAFHFHEEMRRLVDEARATCREHVRWVESVVNDFSRCPVSTQLREELRDREQEFRNRDRNLEGVRKAAGIPDDVDKEAGEFTRLECNVSVHRETFVMSKVLSLAGRSFRWAANPLENFCSPELKAVEEYRLHLRYGDHIPDEQ